MEIQYDPRFPSVEDLRRRTKRRVPGFAYDYLSGGANEEINLRKNRSEIQEVELMPQYITTHSDTDMKTELFGHVYDAPFGIAPVGLQGLIWPKAPEILAKAAFDYNIPFILSTVTSASIETVSEITEGRAWYQLYHPVEDQLRDDLLRRASDAGCPVLVILSDVPTFGYRSKEIKNGLSMPPRMTLRNIRQIMGRPHWAWKTLMNGPPAFEVLKPYIPRGMNMHHLGLFMDQTFDGRLNEEKIKILRDKWKGKLVLKGVASEEDTEKCIRLGLDGIIVSNHGGRQLDAGPSSIKALRRLAPKYGDQIKIMMDSGIRTGPDVARVMACGADFTFMGRTFMYGVGALGEKGGNHTISILRRQLQQVMEQICCGNIRNLPSHLME